MKKATTILELKKNWQIRNSRKQKISTLINYFHCMFPNAPSGQGKVIIEDAFYNGRIIHQEDIPIGDRIFGATKSFLRHQFYFKLHYGYKDKRNEANR